MELLARVVIMDLRQVLNYGGQVVSLWIMQGIFILLIGLTMPLEKLMFQAGLLQLQVQDHLYILGMEYLQLLLM